MTEEPRVLTHDEMEANLISFGWVKDVEESIDGKRVFRRGGAKFSFAPIQEPDQEAQPQ